MTQHIAKIIVAAKASANLIKSGKSSHAKAVDDLLGSIEEIGCSSGFGEVLDELRSALSGLNDEMNEDEVDEEEVAYKKEAVLEGVELLAGSFTHHSVVDIETSSAARDTLRSIREGGSPLVHVRAFIDLKCSPCGVMRAMKRVQYSIDLTDEDLAIRALSIIASHGSEELFSL